MILAEFVMTYNNPVTFERLHVSEQANTKYHNHLAKRSDLYLDKVVAFLYDESGTQATTSSKRPARISSN